MKDNQELINSAKAILKGNDQGGYTVPTHGLYPFQWNWDAAITALGWLTFDESRAWQEIEYLLKGQWDNGMIPHIIFHQEVDSYFPGADVWGVESALKTTSISQPPVLCSVVKKMLSAAADKELAQQSVKTMLDSFIAYHLWWYKSRDPENTGLVVSYHPWESGMDNSPAWDKSLAAVPPVNWDYVRKDTQHVDASERPHAFEYDRYLYLVDFYKKAGFDEQKIYQDCPYKMYDVGIISILHKGTKDLLDICAEFGVADERTDYLRSRVSLTEKGIQQLWNDSAKSFLNKDLISGEFADVQTTGTLMALYGGLATEAQATFILETARHWNTMVSFAGASTYPASDSYEAQRYWRGPVWIHINWLLAQGAENYAATDVVNQLTDSAKQLISKQGYYEYFNCETGDGCGGDAFSWTAAISLFWLL